MYDTINQAEAEIMTREIQIALELGDDGRAEQLANEPAFVALCHRLRTCPIEALKRLREQAAR